MRYITNDERAANGYVPLSPVELRRYQEKWPHQFELGLIPRRHLPGCQAKPYGGPGSVCTCVLLR